MTMGAPGVLSVAVVPDGHHHGDPVMPGLFHRMGQRVEPVVLIGVGAVRQRDDPDVVAVEITVLHHPIDGGDHLGHVDGAVTGADLDVDQMCAGGDPVATEAVGSYPTFSPLPQLPKAVRFLWHCPSGRLAAPPPAHIPVARVTRHRALWCSDFPPPTGVGSDSPPFQDRLHLTRLDPFSQGRAIVLLGCRGSGRLNLARAHGMWTYQSRQGRKAATVVCSASAVVTLAILHLRSTIYDIRSPI